MQISLPSALLVLFVALKLLGYITWSWVWVLSPLWIGFALWALITFTILIAAVVFSSKL